VESAEKEVKQDSLGEQTTTSKRFRHFLRRNRTVALGLFLIALVVFAGLFGKAIAPYDPYNTDSSSRLLPPSSEHLLGTDNYGRDVFSRILTGAGISLYAGFLSTVVAVIPGSIMGLIAAYFPRWDNIVMRFVDIMLAFPGILLALAIVTLLGPNLTNAILATGVWGIPTFARVVRGSVLSVKEYEYIEAARSLGANDLIIIFRHVIPNCIAPVIVLMSMRVGTAILSIAALSFLGMGAQPPSAAWGLMLSEGRAYMRDAWWMTTFPGLAILITVWGFNLVGDGLRDFLDPHVSDN
jgi:peptide/nickel transport system permease protein